MYPLQCVRTDLGRREVVVAVAERPPKPRLARLVRALDVGWMPELQQRAVRRGDPVDPATRKNLSESPL